MKSLLKTTVAAILVLVMTGWAFAYETDFDDLHRYTQNLPGWKLGRGITNILSGPHELFAAMTNDAIKGAYWGAYDGGFQGYIAGSTNGFIAGSLSGTFKALKRMTLGGLEILTFWKPEYGPTMDPEYGTRCRAFTDNDYFDPDPFWYTGPPR